jgi:fatty acid desaturase
MRTPQLAWMLASDALGIGFVKFLVVALRLPREPKGGVERRDRVFAIARLVYLAALAAMIVWLHLGLPFLLYWVVPYLTWMQVCFHVRSIAEHWGIRGRHGVYAQTRTVVASLFDRLFLVPNNVGYHLEHHLYPSVPFYRLPELHTRLMALPAYRDSAHVTRGYFNALRECSLRIETQETA